MHIPVLQNIDEEIQECQAIVAVPEDSVANHMFSLYSSFSNFLEIKIINLSASQSDDSVMGAQLIIGTLGDITAALARKSFSLEQVKMIILHEIDRLINNDGSNSLVEFIHEFQHPQLCITATSVNSLVIDFIEEQTQSDRIVIKRSILDRLRFDGVYQNYLEITDEFRYDALVDVLDSFRKNPNRRFWVVVYCNQARTAEFVFSKLSCDRDYKIAIVTDKTSPDERATTMQSFNKGRGEIEVLVTSEKFGLEEIDRIYLPLSIQYQFPETEKDYIIRTARYATILGSLSFTVNFISGPDEMNRLHAIRKRFQIKVNELSESILLG
jgi:superfamily II DNA/RNA helicase